MAFRIHDSIVSGEIDNREKGVVRGKLWIHGRTEPVVLELTGNAHPDLAGCLLKFTNPLKTLAHQHLDSLNVLQRGSIGDLTASRKVRVFDMPFEDAIALVRQGGKPPERMANSLYLEWFSEANGRVVVESADYNLEVSAPEWRLTPEENDQRAKQAAAGMDDFMQKLGEAIQSQRHDGSKDIEEWDEFDYEKSLKESDAITNKYMELLDKYGDSPEAEALIAKEMGWDHNDEDDTDDDVDAGEEDEADDRPMSAEELNRIAEEAMANPVDPDPLTEGVDWIRVEDDDIRHPLAHRSFETTIAWMHEVDALGIDEAEHREIAVFLEEFQITGAKLAGALNGLAYGRDHREGAFVVACLKRALNHLHKSQAGLEKVSLTRSLPDELVLRYRKELFEIREEILRLMKEFRGE